MTSSNRHWPSLFKSKPCNSQQWTQQNDPNPSPHISTACPKPPHASASSVAGERGPEPKPRWNPRPEQIRILEGIFNSGMVNPPRDEIRKIRLQLQEYGPVGDANIFYWFQNRKSRSKHKQRLQQQQNQQSPRSVTKAITACSSSSSSSSSSDPSTPAKATKKAVVSTSPTGSVNQTSHHAFPQVPGYDHATNYYHDRQSQLGLVPTGFWSELLFNEGCNKAIDATNCMDFGDEGRKEKLLLQYSLYGAAVPSSANSTTSPIDETATLFPSTSANYVVTVPDNNSNNNIAISGLDFFHGNGTDVGNYGDIASSRSMVFINEVAFEVGNGLVNIREAFGQEALLFSSSGLPVLVDEWGVTLQPLQPGASYYLICSSHI